jgi:hypothetical protein
MAIDIKEKLSDLWRIIKSNIDRSAFMLFLLLLILMSGIYGYEITRPEPEQELPGGGNLPRKIPNDQYKKSINYIKSNVDLEKDEELKIIKYFNIFDYKYVRDKNELQKEADKKFTRAVKLYEEKKPDEATKVLKEILLTWPSHLSSKELLSRIEAGKATPTPTPTPKSPVTAPPGGMPGREEM